MHGMVTFLLLQVQEQVSAVHVLDYPSRHTRPPRRDVARGGAEGAVASPLSLIQRFSKDDTTPLTTPKRGKNDVEMP